ALSASGCATPPVQEDPDPVQATAAPCRTPAHLVRDLTAPWSLRTYVIGPCLGARSRAVSTRPAAPASSVIESEKPAP
ncbi:MAG: hypothetical protein ACREX4_17250, partial [Gammaproteobacteria bacterium]